MERQTERMRKMLDIECVIVWGREIKGNKEIVCVRESGKTDRE